MHTSKLRNRIVSIICVGAAAIWTANLSGYSLSGRTWGTNSVLYYANLQNATGLTQTSIVDALKRAGDVWRDQTHANIELIYAGTTGGSSFSLNYKNEVFFRNTPSGYGGETYWWYDGSGRLVDFDVAFYESSLAIATVPGTCSGAGIYLDDLAVHEFGHALGLDHSSVAGATMAPFMPAYCDTTQMTLDADDIAGIERAYPAAVVVATPSAPSQISVAQNASSPTSSLKVSWADNAGNESGFRLERSANGSTFTQIAQLGANTTSFVNTGLSGGTTYYYRVYAYNSGGNSAYSDSASGQTTSAQAPPPPPPAPPPPAPAPPAASASSPTVTLQGTRTGTRTNSSLRVNVYWSGLVGSKVDIYRNGSRLTSPGNDGHYLNSISKKSGTFQYKVCSRGSAPVCTNTATITF